MAQLVERQYENRKVRGIFEPQKMKADHVTKSFMICDLSEVLWSDQEG
jgi:hypothetical protein